MLNIVVRTLVMKQSLAIYQSPRMLDWITAKVQEGVSMDRILDDIHDGVLTYSQPTTSLVKFTYYTEEGHEVIRRFVSNVWLSMLNALNSIGLQWLKPKVE